MLVAVIAVLWDSVIVPRAPAPVDPVPMTDPGSGDDAPEPAPRDSASLSTNAVSGLNPAKE